MVKMNRRAEKTEMQPCVDEWLLRSDVHAWTSENGCGSERRRNGEGLEGAPNGVRGDDVVVVSEARRVSNGVTNRTMEAGHHEGR